MGTEQSKSSIIGSGTGVGVGVGGGVGVGAGVGVGKGLSDNDPVVTDTFLVLSGGVCFVLIR